MKQLPRSQFLIVLAIAILLGIAIPQIADARATWLVVLWAGWGLTVLGSVTLPVFSVPLAAINGSMLVFVIIPATIHVASHRASLGPGYDFTAGMKAALEISALAQWSFFGGALIARSIRPLPRLASVRVALSRPRLEWTALVCIVVGLLGLAGEVASGASLSQFFVFLTQKGYGSFYSSATSPVNGYLLPVQLTAGVALVLVVLRFTSAQVKSGYWLSLGILTLSTLLLLGNGQRVRFLVPLVAAGLVWIKTTDRKVGLRRTMLLAFVAILGLSAVIGIVRGVSGSRSVTLQSVSQQAFERDELFAPLAGLTIVLPSETPYLHGKSYTETPVFVVPRALWPGKPKGEISSVTKLFDPGNAGLAFPEYGEMYANFGLPGVIIGSILFGLLVEWLWIRFATSESLPEAVLLAVVFSILAELFVRGATAPMLVTFLGYFGATAFICRRGSRILASPDRATEPIVPNWRAHPQSLGTTAGPWIRR